MKTKEECDALALEIYWMLERGQNNSATRKLLAFQLDANMDGMKEAAELCDRISGAHANPGCKHGARNCRDGISNARDAKTI